MIGLTASLVRRAGEESIPGTFLRGFVHNGGYYFLVEIEIYKDGMIDCWGLLTLDEFKREVHGGRVVTQIPEGASVVITVGVNLAATTAQSFVEEDEFIKEVEDAIRELNNEPTTLQVCRDMLRAYQAEPSEAARDRLREAYEAIPKHRRMFVDGMENKDNEVRAILGL